MLADAEVLEHACDQRLVSMAGERRALQDHLATGEHSPRQGYRRRIQDDHIDRVSTKMLGRRVSDSEAHRKGIRLIRNVNREIDVAARRSTPGNRAAEHIGEPNVRRDGSNRIAQTGQAPLEIWRNGFAQRHQSSIRGINGAWPCDNPPGRTPSEHHHHLSDDKTELSAYVAPAPVHPKSWEEGREGIRSRLQATGTSEPEPKAYSPIRSRP